MAILKIHHIFLLASLVLIAGVEAENKVKEFETLKNDVFGKGRSEFLGTEVEKKIQRMIDLIESGDIPAEVQGVQTLEYLKSVTDDCKKSECNLNEDPKRVKRLNERNTGAPNFETYLQLCRVMIESRCNSQGIIPLIRDKNRSVFFFGLRR